MDSDLVIRVAGEDDAALLAEMGGRMFRDAFGESNRPEDMDDYIASNFSLAEIRRELEDPASTFLIAYNGETAIGYARLIRGPKAEDVTGPSPIELNRIYLDQAAIGKGYGSALMQACLDTAEGGGYRTIWLGVWEKNGRAIAFYEKWGFSAVGSQRFVLGSDMQRDVVMARPVVLNVE